MFLICVPEVVDFIDLFVWIFVIYLSLLGEGRSKGLGRCSFVLLAKFNRMQRKSCLATPWGPRYGHFNVWSALSLARSLVRPRSLARPCSLSPSFPRSLAPRLLARFSLARLSLAPRSPPVRPAARSPSRSLAMWMPGYLHLQHTR